MDIRKQALARLEVLPDWRVKRWFKVLYAGVAFGTLALFTLTVLKATKRLDHVTDARNYVVANVAVASVCASATFGCLIAYIFRIWQVRRAGLRFTRRRGILQSLLFVQLASQALSSLFYFLPNAHIVTSLDIGNIPQDDLVLRLSELVRITMWNNIFLVFVLRARLFNLWVDKHDRPIGREDALLLDAPLHTHWPVVAVWGVMQSFNAFIFGYSYVIDHDWLTVTDTTCDPKPILLAAVASYTVCTFAYQMLAVYYVYRAYQQLQRKPYNLFRWTNVAVRFHYLEVGVIGDFLTMSLGLLWFVRFRSCSTMVLIWFGMLPAQLGMSMWAVVTTILMMPSRPGRQLKENIDRCRLKWREWELKDSWHCKDPNHKIGPHFCFETMLKCWYWSLCAYGYDPVDKQCKDPEFDKLNLCVAKQLYGLEHHDYLRSDVDNRVLISWSSEMILISFRGTYSVKNVWSDLQCWRVFHPPKRGSYFFRTAPLVHKGFSHSWTFDGLNHKILNRVIQISHSPGFDKSKMKVVVTGHSLGGAVAILCAFDIARHCGFTPNQISCYTFGAPRVGNHAFVKEYNERVPDTWQIVNDQDVIPQMPKFWLLFKHAGERVIINQSGDMIIAPLFVEVSLYKCFKFFGASNAVGQHFLLSYLKAKHAIIDAQFIQHKGLPGGMDSMREMFVKDNGCTMICDALGVDFKSFGQQKPSACCKCKKICKRSSGPRKERLVKSLNSMLTRWSSLQRALGNGPNREADVELSSVERTEKVCADVA